MLAEPVERGTKRLRGKDYSFVRYTDGRTASLEISATPPATPRTSTSSGSTHPEARTTRSILVG